MWPALLLAILSLPAPQAVTQEAGQVPQGPVTVSVSDLTVKIYRPRNVTAQELYRLAGQMLGRGLAVKEHGVPSSYVSNVQLLGDTLVLYDTKEYLERMTPMLQALDDGSAESEERVRKGALVTWEYTPRYLSLEATYEILQPLRRPVLSSLDPRAEGMPAAAPQTANISLSEEQRLVVVRDTEAQVTAIRSLLQRVDVLPDQVSITCWLLRSGAQSGEKSNLPAALVEHLSRLVPGQALRQIGFGFVQSSVSTGRPVSVQLAVPGEGPDGGPPFFLDLRPMAYDRETGSLTVSGCSLANAPGAAGLFSTSAVLRGGEYTVIGASGSAPILVALRVDPVGR